MLFNAQAVRANFAMLTSLECHHMVRARREEKVGIRVWNQTAGMKRIAHVPAPVDVLISLAHDCLVDVVGGRRVRRADCIASDLWGC